MKTVQRLGRIIGVLGSGVFLAGILLGGCSSGFVRGGGQDAAIAKHMEKMDKIRVDFLRDIGNLMDLNVRQKKLKDIQQWRAHLKELKGMFPQVAETPAQKNRYIDLLNEVEKKVLALKVAVEAGDGGKTQEILGEIKAIKAQGHDEFG